MLASLFQKPKPQASVENWIMKFHKLSDVYNTIHKNLMGRGVYGSSDGNVTVAANIAHNHALTAGDEKISVY